MKFFTSKFTVPVVTILLCILFQLIAGCTGVDEKSTKKETLLTSGTQSVTLELLALDDPDNPYREQYTAYDRWVFEHVVIPGTEEPVKLPSEMTQEEIHALALGTDQPMNWYETSARVYDESILVPFQISMRDNHEAIKNHTKSELANRSTIVRVKGVLDPELRKVFRREADRIVAGYYPPVPAWLAENPPKRVMLLPDGRVLTEGLLGDWDKEDEEGGCCGDSVQGTYALYDISGTLQAARQSGWLGLLDNSTEAEQPQGHAIWTDDGYWKFYDRETDGLIAVWDFDGTPLASEEDTVPRDPHFFRWISGSLARTYYNVLNDSVD